MSWQLAQTFWVGGLWMLHFVLLPALERMGWAPLLVEDVTQVLRPLLVGFAAFCIALQLLVLMQAVLITTTLMHLVGPVLTKWSLKTLARECPQDPPKGA